VWVEAESNKVGDLQIPKDLWQVMKAARGVEVRLPTAERVRHLLAEYDHFVRNPASLKELLDKLRAKLGGIVDGWFADINAGRWERFVANVLTQHYDPAYRHSRERDFPNANTPVELTDASDAAIRAVAEQLAHESRSRSRDRQGAGPRLAEPATC
jgi:tRNA 2-selenouridine synthase